MLVVNVELDMCIGVHVDNMLAVGPCESTKSLLQELAKRHGNASGHGVQSFAGATTSLRSPVLIPRKQIHKFFVLLGRARLRGTSKTICQQEPYKAAGYRSWLSVAL